MAQAPSFRRTTRRLVTVAGSTLLASALLLGTAGCSPSTHIAISPDGITVEDDSGSTSIPFASAVSLGERTITVSGTTSVNATPDTAELSLGIVAEATDASTAQKNAAQTVEAVTEALEELGIDSDSITTEDVYLNPQYDYSSSTEKIVGYQMNVSMMVKDLSIEEAGTAIGVATTAGANRVQGVSYYCSNYDELYQEALAQALAAAETKARGMAEASGDTLGVALNVTEGYESQAYRNESAGKLAAGAITEDAAVDSDGGPALGLDPGAVQIRATVTVEYAVS